MKHDGAALEYADGRPTYRVIPGLSGASRAFAVASHVGLDHRIVERARALLDATSPAFFFVAVFLFQGAVFSASGNVLTFSQIQDEDEPEPEKPEPEAEESVPAGAEAD